MYYIVCHSNVHGQLSVSTRLAAEYGANVHYLLIDMVQRYLMTVSEVETELPVGVEGQTANSTIQRTVAHLVRSAGVDCSPLQRLAIQRRMLRYMQPWFARVKLHPQRGDSDLVLAILLTASEPWMKMSLSGASEENASEDDDDLATASDLLSGEVEAMWLQVARHSSNITLALQSMISYLCQSVVSDQSRRGSSSLPGPNLLDVESQTYENSDCISFVGSIMQQAKQV